jgi:hydroxymethylglutaryl-CoA lyase
MTMSDLPKSVMIFEEGPREGFQIEKGRLSTDDKVRLIDALSETGVKHIQVGSFVDPRRVPSMADVDDIVKRMKIVPGVEYSVLWMNERGLRKALEYPQLSVDGKLRLYPSATFLKMNMGRTPEQHAQKNIEMITLCRNLDVPVTQAALSSAFGCNFQGDISLKLLEELMTDALRLAEGEGVKLEELVIADTMAWATPEAIRRVVGAMQDKFPHLEIRLHLHDTRGMGLANAYAGLTMGVQSFDSCVAGLGGCPFAKHKGASGNICTEDFVLMCEEMGIATGVNLDAMMAASALAEEIVGHPVPGHTAKAGSLNEIRARVTAAA